MIGCETFFTALRNLTMPRISVVIPVYNTELYLEEAIRSIMEQTFTDIEIIIIDDGSTDNSLSIANTLAEEDNRVSVHSQENKGQSEARNHGLSKVQGDYVYFMDSDDRLAPAALATCYERLEADDLEIVFFNAAIQQDDASVRIAFDYERPPIDDKKVFTGTSLVEYLIDRDCYRCSVCLYVAKKSTIDRIGLSFYPRIIHEDELYTALLFFEAQRMGYINQEFFYRRVRAGSTMLSKFSMKNMHGYFTVARELSEYSRRADSQLTGVVRKLLHYLLSPAVYNASTLPFADRLAVFGMLKNYEFTRYIKPKNLTVLAIPQLITLKGFFKRFLTATN